MAKEINTLLEQAEAALKTPSSIPLTVADLAKRVSDVDGLYTWVKTHTHLVAYQGILRGPHGVLMDGNGNSLDRSLLLAHTLKTTGQTVRLKRATLAPEQVKRALEPLFRTAPTPPDAESSNAAEAEMLGQLDADTRASLQAQQEKTSALIKEMKATARQQADAIAQAVSFSTESDDSWVKALSDHWWVEVETDGVWRALDPQPNGRAAPTQRRRRRGFGRSA